MSKTRVGIVAAKRFQDKNPNHKIIIVVPSDPIKTQWLEELAIYKVIADVITMHVASKRNFECSLLIIDKFCRCKTYLTAGNSLELLNYKVNGNIKLDMFKNQKIGQSAAKIL